MPYLIGAVLSVCVAIFAWRVGLDRERAFYTTVLIVVGSYYVLFAAMAESPRTLFIETALMAVFVAMAVAGFRSSMWIVVAGLAGHGVFDAFHGSLVTNPGVPAWWPAFCGTYDIGAAGCLAWITIRRPAARLKTMSASGSD